MSVLDIFHFFLKMLWARTEDMTKVSDLQPQIRYIVSDIIETSLVEYFKGLIKDEPLPDESSAPKS